MQSVGFDFTYDKQLLDREGGGNVGSLQNWLTSNSQYFISHSAHCMSQKFSSLRHTHLTLHSLLLLFVVLSNHDEVRAVTYFGSWWRSDAAALLTYTLPGMRFYWMGDWQVRVTGKSFLLFSNCNWLLLLCRGIKTSSIFTSGVQLVSPSIRMCRDSMASSLTS